MLKCFYPSIQLQTLIVHLFLNIFLSGSKNTKSDNVKNKEFDDWLVDVCTGDKLNNIERERKKWSSGQKHLSQGFAIQGKSI